MCIHCGDTGVTLHRQTLEHFGNMVTLEECFYCDCAAGSSKRYYDQLSEEDCPMCKGEGVYFFDTETGFVPCPCMEENK